MSLGCPCAACTSSSNKAAIICEQNCFDQRSEIVFYLDLIRVKSPVLQFLLEQRPANIGGVVKLARPVVVKNLREDHGMSIKQNPDTQLHCIGKYF